MGSPEPVAVGQPVEMPWPDVPECYGHRGDVACAQCGGDHEHGWVTWRAVPQGHPLSFGPGLPVRCGTCGGRKCDLPVCWERRHHQGPHTDIDGVQFPTAGMLL